jgi:CSLREA domain-containing protein
MRARHPVLVLVILAVLGIPGAGHARAAGSTIAVTTTSDATAADGQCSLREAIDAANGDVAVDTCAAGNGADTIDVPAGTYAIGIDGSQEDQNATGDLDLTSDVSIVGAGPAATTIDGASLDRVMHIPGAASVSLSGLTITGGRPDPDYVVDGAGGGIDNVAGSVALDDVVVTGNGSTDLYVSAAGIRNGGTMTITRSVVSGNVAYGGDAGGILNTGKMTIEDSSVAGNGNLLGGGIRNDGTISIARTAIIGNSAVQTDYSPAAGGGLHNTGTATLVNTTVSGNVASATERASAHGAGIFNGGGLNLSGVTVTDNHDGVACSPVSCAITGHDAGIAGPATLALTIVARNTWSRDDPFDNGGSAAGAGDCASLTSLGGNVIGNTADCVVTGAMSTDRLDVDPLLGPLADNGGPTQTHALQLGSPAIDLVAAGSLGCGTTLAADQRGVARPQGKGCDSGAFEAEVQYAFSGFFGPLKKQVAPVNAGAVVAVMFSLDGDQGLGVLAAGSPESRRVSCSTGASLGPLDPTLAAGGSGLTYDRATDRYGYAWKTRKAWAGTCRELVLTLADQSVHRVRIAFR